MVDFAFFLCLAIFFREMERFSISSSLQLEQDIVGVDRRN
jgi:hypothetical protein